MLSARKTFLACSMAAAILAVPTSAFAANTLDLTFVPAAGSTVTDETEVVVTARGTTNGDYGVYVKFLPLADSCPLYSKAATWTGNNFALAEDAWGVFSYSASVGPNPEGEYMFCGWIQRAFDATSAYRITKVDVTVESSADTGGGDTGGGDTGGGDTGGGDTGGGDTGGGDTGGGGDAAAKCTQAKTSLSAAKRKVISARKALRGKKGKAKAKAKRRYQSAQRTRDRAQGRADALCS